MEKLGATEISHTGHKEVENWLINNGFVNVLSNDQGYDGVTGIEANGTIENILVHVRAALQPEEPGRLKAADKTKIRGSAEKLARKAYVAYVVLDPEKNIVGEISWERLS